MATLLPAVMWAQRNDKIYLTFNMEDAKDYVINIEDSKLYFKACCGKDKKIYEIVIEFYGKVNPKESKYIVLARNVPMIIQKADPGPYWPRLVKGESKQHWLKTDFDKWKDEDESEDEEFSMGGGGGGGGGMGGASLEDMMKNMGNFNANGDGPGLSKYDDEDDNDSKDSDDEDLPGLQ